MTQHPDAHPAARLIYNPVAGQGKAAHIYRQLLPHLTAASVEVVETRGPGHATELAREVADRANITVISLGGDGTHHEVINGLLPAGHATFGAIPAGTGNDFVRVLRYPADPAQLLAVLLTGETAPFDVGRIGDQYFLTVAGIGFDAEVAGWVNQHGKQGNGTWVFLRGILYNLFGYRPAELTVRLDGGPPVTRTTLMMALGNTPYYAGGMQICPDAHWQDGKFSVVWVGSLSPVKILPLLGKVFRGRHIHHPAVLVHEARRIRVEGPPALWVHADGELLGHLPVTAEIVPGALNVRVGPAYMKP